MHGPSPSSTPNTPPSPSLSLPPQPLSPSLPPQSPSPDLHHSNVLTNQRRNASVVQLQILHQIRHRSRLQQPSAMWTPATVPDGKIPSATVWSTVHAVSKQSRRRVVHSTHAHGVRSAISTQITVR
ncbi:hypothetical protein M758_7G035600 [Ceratodon purpureus]|nr:hypothetical protein M758_7G035600 [Ceratodon purpureus]